jgi:hypothetical protein
MNERINELVLTARQQATSDTKDGGKQFDLDLFHKKFAELIVKECVTVAMKAVSDDEPKEAWYLIKEHFGVGE